MGNRIIDENKIGKEPKNNRIANDEGVDSSYFVRHLIIATSNRFINICQHINTLPLLLIHYSRRDIILFLSFTLETCSQGEI